MSNVIYGNMVGGGTAPLKTLILEDESGNQFTGVVTGSEVIFTATDNDVREGMVYASDNGVSTGTKNIPSYNTSEGRKIITKGSKFILPISDYDYTKLQAIFCTFNTNADNSVAAEHVAINDFVYGVQSVTPVSEITKVTSGTSGAIDFGITNTSSSPCILRYFTYKEIY